MSLEGKIKTNRTYSFFSLLLLIFVFTIINNPVYSEENASAVSDKTAVNSRIDNLTMAEALTTLSKVWAVDFKGMRPSNENISVNLSGLSLGETLKKILKGYNYVLIQPENAQKTIVYIIGKADRQPARNDTHQVAGTGGNAAIHQGATVNIVPAQSPAPAAVPVMPVEPVAKGIKPDLNDRGSEKENHHEELSMMPPMPPVIAGLETPPMPPGFPGSRVIKKTVSTASPNAEIPPQVPGMEMLPPSMPQLTEGSTPPAIPSDLSTAPAGAGTGGQTQQPPASSAKEDEKDLRPPSIPF